MTIPRNKFPFKWMPKIIHVLNNTEGEVLLPLSRISGLIGTCLPDGSEVTRMLHYLTHFGRVDKLDSNEWKLNYASMHSPPEINFRFRYIEGLVSVLKELKVHPKNIEEIASSISRDSQEIEEYLIFLEEITKYGRLSVNGRGYQQLWHLDPWPDENLGK